MNHDRVYVIFDDGQILLVMVLIYIVKNLNQVNILVKLILIRRSDSAGLREHDRIVEVNFVPIGNENHKQVVSRIKEGVSRNGTKYPEEVILLVLDPDVDVYYKNKSIIVRSSYWNVETLETEIRDETGLSWKKRKKNYLYGFWFIFIPENGDQSPPSSNKSIGNRDSPIPIIRETTSRTIQNEPNREYKHVTDFTGPTVTHTTKVKIYLTYLSFFLSNKSFDDNYLNRISKFYFWHCRLFCF